MRKEKITETITSAINHLEGSMEAFVKKDEKKVLYLVWQTAADLEYALFIFSLMHQDKSEISSWKLNPCSKQVEMESTLASVLSLLEEAKGSVETDDLLEAYKKTWIARGCLLKLHGIFEKRRRDGEKSIIPL